MKQSLPGIKYIGYVPLSLLPPHILQKYQARVPIGIFQIPTAIEHYGNAKCEAEQEYDNGSYIEKTVLQFTTTDEVPNGQELAFVVTAVDGQSYIIGQREEPFPMVEISQKMDVDTNIFDIKVAFTRRKSLVPCLI